MNSEQVILERLNEDQQKAVAATEGPVLILAGAGSGKTRALVHRIAYLIDVIGVSPGEILAITFTNKAADEMTSRVDEMIGFGSKEIWVSTFHSLCVRILRRYGELLGFSRSFSIYDSDDQLSVMKSLFKLKQIDPRYMKEKVVLSRISSAKDELIGPEKYAELNTDFYGAKVAELYRAYQDRLAENNAMDFDDLIRNAVLLFEKHPEVLDVYQERFRYMMVDEYQDTNTAQFRLVSLLAGKYRNLCVVGDDDQSIYKFRGANIHNILSFEKVFPDAVVVKLERNYRSTGKILDAANEVIRHNKGRKDKRLWTRNPEGDKLSFRTFANGFEEAEYVCGEVSAAVRKGARHFRDFAVLYRTNAQSRLFEEKMLMGNIPYKIVGGVNFYSRKEIKDILAYLKTVDNSSDNLQAQRIINIPKRGIGSTTIERLLSFAEESGITFYEAACRAGDVPGVSAGTAKKIESFTDLIGVLRANAENGSVPDLIRKLLEFTGYRKDLEEEGTDEALGRVENIDELISKAVQYEEEKDHPTLSGFLEEVALIADIDTVADDDDRVLLMTLHSAKGLEFPAVFMAGMEEGLFPSSMSINSPDSREEIEEERRLCYVGITRAKESLTLTCARERMIRGEVQRSMVSRFIREIPRELMELEGEGMEKPARTWTLSGRGADKTMRDAVLSSPPPAALYGGQPVFGGAAKSAAASKAEESGSPDYAVGDTVQHVKFGKGTVLEMKDSGKGTFVTVDFEAWGTKKMLAAMARLKKV